LPQLDLSFSDQPARRFSPIREAALNSAYLRLPQHNLGRRLLSAAVAASTSLLQVAGFEKNRCLSYRLVLVK